MHASCIPWCLHCAISCRKSGGLPGRILQTFALSGAASRVRVLATTTKILSPQNKTTTAYLIGAWGQPASEIA
jgi:hypothetical protein